MSGKPDEDVLAKLGKNAELPELSSPALWSAIGMLRAETDKPEEAQRSLARALEREDWDSSDAKPWAIAGKIYQQYGLQEEAGEAFAKARTRAASGESTKWTLSILLSWGSEEVGAGGSDF